MGFQFHSPFFPCRKMFHWPDRQLVRHLLSANSNESILRWSRSLPANSLLYLSPFHTFCPNQFGAFEHPVLSCETQRGCSVKFADILPTGYWLPRECPALYTSKKMRHRPV